MSYVHPLASFLTPDTIRLGVKVGPDGNDRRSVCPVARILTEVPPTSTTSTFLAENVFATRLRVAFMLSPPAAPLSRQRRTPFGLIAAAIATAPVGGGEQREFSGILHALCLPCPGIPQMTRKLTQIFALVRPCCKRCGWLPAARVARTMVEEMIWLFSLASGRIPPVDCS